MAGRYTWMALMNQLHWTVLCDNKVKVPQQFGFEKFSLVCNPRKRRKPIASFSILDAYKWKVARTQEVQQDESYPSIWGLRGLNTSLCDITPLTYHSLKYSVSHCVASLQQNLTPEERSKFLDDGDGLYLCPRNTPASRINDSKMAASGNLVVLIPARHTGLGDSKASGDEAEGLVAKLKLIEGAKVMLTQNIRTKQFNQCFHWNNTYCTLIDSNEYVR